MFNLLLSVIYLCFVSLGLPDSLLGSAWPVMQFDIGAPVSFAGIISLVISLGTIVSSILCDRMLKKLGSGRLTAFSTLLTAVALLGFSFSNSFWMLILWAIPYGLGAGAVDAVLNNFVALHYKAQYMSWAHCFWGVGASISPYIMSFAIQRLNNWSSGYLTVSVVQLVITGCIFLSLPLWKKTEGSEAFGENEQASAPVSIKEILKVPGSKALFLAFFAYCGLELTAGLWASTYLVQARGVSPELASSFASFFYLGLTVGRIINGFLAIRFGDRTLIRLGSSVIFSGIVLLFLPFSSILSLAGFVIIGLGCAPIYPCTIHMVPYVFGKDKSQAMIGLQMAFAYLGFCLMPPLFGFIAEQITVKLLPLYLVLMLALMVIMHEVMEIKTQKENK